jgi:hypothetical protein
MAPQRRYFVRPPGRAARNPESGGTYVKLRIDSGQGEEDDLSQ